MMAQKGRFMKIVTIGDSITVGTYTSETDSSPNSVVQRNFSEVVKDKLGCDTLINYAHNGISISTTAPVFPEKAIVTRYLIMEEADIVLVCAGTNDFGNGVAIGSPQDTEDGSFYGAVDILFSGLKKKYPNSEIYIVEPIHRFDELENKIGLSLESYRTVLEEKAGQYGIPTIDGFKVPIDPKLDLHRKLYAKDGLHINQEGHRLYGEYIYQKILDIRKVNKHGNLSL